MENKPTESLYSISLQSPKLHAQLMRTFRAGFVVALMLGIAVAFYHVLNDTYRDNRVSRFSVRNWINLKESNNPRSALRGDLRNTPEIRIAVGPILSPEKSMEMYKSFVDYVGARLGRKPKALYRPTYSETNDLVRYQMCDFAIVGTYPFIRGEREFGMRALVVPQVNGSETNQSVIIAARKSDAASLLDLRGKRFAAADIISTTGWLYPAMVLMNAGKDPNRFFDSIIITGSHDRSVQAVIDGFVDGAAVHSLVFDQMVAEDRSVLQKARILEKSPPFGIQPIVINPKLDPDLKEAVRSVLLNMDKDKEGKQILTKLQIERFVVPGPHLFDPLRLAVSKLEKWR